MNILISIEHWKSSVTSLRFQAHHWEKMQQKLCMERETCKTCWQVTGQSSSFCRQGLAFFHLSKRKFTKQARWSTKSFTSLGTKRLVHVEIPRLPFSTITCPQCDVKTLAGTVWDFAWLVQLCLWLSQQWSIRRRAIHFLQFKTLFVDVMATFRSLSHFFWGVLLYKLPCPES